MKLNQITQRTGYLVAWIALAFLAGCNDAQGSEKASLPANPPSQPAATASASAEGATLPAVAPASDARESHRLTGTTTAERQSAVAAKGMGMLQELLVKEGDWVKKGDIIARLDGTTAALQLRQAKAAVASAKVQVAAGDREHKRLASLAQDGAIAGAQLDQAITGRDAAHAGLAQAEAAMAMAQQALANSVVVAPYDGVVVQRLKAEGEWVSTMPPSPLMVLADTETLNLNLQAPEHLLTQVQLGDAVTVDFAAIGKQVEAEVTRLVPVVQPMTRTFTVIVELDNADGTLSPGLFAEVTLVPAAREPATPRTVTASAKVEAKP